MNNLIGLSYNKGSLLPHVWEKCETKEVSILHVAKVFIALCRNKSEVIIKG
jgi:hypothetical protein